MAFVLQTLTLSNIPMHHLATIQYIEAILYLSNVATSTEDHEATDEHESQGRELEHLANCPTQSIASTVVRSRFANNQFAQELD